MRRIAVVGLSALSIGACASANARTTQRSCGIASDGTRTALWAQATLHGASATVTATWEPGITVSKHYDVTPGRGYHARIEIVAPAGFRLASCKVVVS